MSNAHHPQLPGPDVARSGRSPGLRHWSRMGLLLLLGLVFATAGLQGPAPSSAGLAGQGPSGDQLPAEPAWLLHRTPLSETGHWAQGSPNDTPTSDTGPAGLPERPATLPGLAAEPRPAGEPKPPRRADPSLAPILARAPPASVLISG